MALGLGNFLYTIEIADGKAMFHFYDPEDASNTADVEVSKSEFPEGITQADSRQVADLAFAQCQKVLNDKRDERIHKQASADLKNKQAVDSQQREDAADFFDKSEELANTTPTGVPSKEQPVKEAPPHNEPAQDTTPDESKKSEQKADDKKSK